MGKREVNVNNNEDIMNYFMPFNVEELHDKEAMKLIIKLKEENKKLKLLVKKIEAKLERNYKNPFNKQYNYNELEEKFSKEYSELSDISLKNLITAEYLFLNEKLSIDYTGIFIAYIKVIELELRDKFNISENISLGGIFRKIKLIPEFRSFIKVMEDNDFKRIRNRGVHMNTISKADCGKIRKVLIEEGWLNRLIFLIEEHYETKSPKKAILIEDRILEEDVKEKLGDKFFNSYITEKGRFLLSQKHLPIGTFRALGIENEVNGIEYLIIQ